MFSTKTQFTAGVAAVLTLFIAQVALSEIQSDEFNSNSFTAPWEWWNEPAGNWSLAGGELTIDASTNANLWAANDAHFLYQHSTGDFDVETHLSATWDTASMVAGVVAQSVADDNWVTLKLWGRGGDSVIQFQGKEEALGPDTAGQPVGEWSLFMRLRRNGDTYTSFTKQNAGDAWVEYAVADKALTGPLYVGIYAGVADPTGTLTAAFDFVRDALGPEPGTAVDAKGKVTTTWAALKTAR